MQLPQTTPRRVDAGPGVSSGASGTAGRAASPAAAERTERLSSAGLMRDLPPAIARREFVPFYQPILELRTGQLLGFESLARWQHPQLGMLGPNLFIPIAESLGAIGELSYALLAQACRDARDWPDHVTLSINISPVQLADPQLPQRLLGILHDGGIASRRLIVELTESGPVSDLVTARQIMAILRKADIRVMLDDFGAGSASLRCLSELPFDGIKIDRSLLGTLGSAKGRTIVRAIVELAQRLGMMAVIEGVETREQADAMIAMDCGYAQGFLFGRAMPATAALRMTQAGAFAALFGG